MQREAADLVATVTGPAISKAKAVDGDAGVSPGDVVGHYVIEEALGRGGMGVVFAARHDVLGHRVAMKFVSTRASADVLARFSREAKIIASLESDHVVRVVDYGMHAGMPYMAMDLLSGRDLGRELALSGKLGVSDAVDYVIEACSGLWAAHEKGIVHRDVKVANLFLATRADGERIVKVLDFGVSKLQEDADEDVSLTRTATMIGSPLYMSPEQIRDPRAVDARADVWSLGIVLHKLLTGNTPFTALSANAVCAAIVADPPATLRSHAPDLPAELEVVVLRCLEKRAALRYSSVVALARDLGPFASAKGKSIADKLRARATADGAIEPAPPPEVEATAPLEKTSATSVVDKRPSAPRPRNVIAWVGLGAVVVAATVASAMRHPSGGAANTESSAAPMIASAPSAEASQVAPPVAETSPIAAASIAATTAASAPLPIASARRPGFAPPRRDRAAPPPTPKPAVARPHFGGSALDDHN